MVVVAGRPAGAFLGPDQGRPPSSPPLPLLFHGRRPDPPGRPRPTGPCPADQLVVRPHRRAGSWGRKDGQLVAIRESEGRGIEMFDFYSAWGGLILKRTPPIPSPPLPSHNAPTQALWPIPRPHRPRPPREGRPGWGVAGRQPFDQLVVRGG